MDIIPYLGYDLAAASAPSVDERGPKPARAVSILLLLREALDPTATSVAIRAMERPTRAIVALPSSCYFTRTGSLARPSNYRAKMTRGGQRWWATGAAM